MAQPITFDWQTGEDEFLHYAAKHFDAPGAMSFTDASRYVQTPPTDALPAWTPYAAWGDTPRHASAMRDGERALTLMALRGLAALLFVLLAAGSAPMSPEQVDRAAIERDLSLVLELDEAAWRARDRERYEALIDPLTPAAWVSGWRDNWGARSETGRLYALTLGRTHRLDEDLIRAEVYVDLPRTNWWQPAVVRETRFYRQANGQWLRTLPPDSYWGELQALRTPSFTFRYFEADAASVAVAAERLEPAVAELYELFDVAAYARASRSVIVLRPGMERTMWWDRRDIEISSPSLAQIPRGESDADYIASRTFSRVASSVLRTSGGGYRWAFMYTVMRGWLSAEMLDQPSRWREESVEVFRAHARTRLPLELSDIDDYYVEGRPGRATVLWRYAAASSLLDYLVATQGLDALPRLLAALADYGSWSTLIEAATGQSLDEFTAGWNAYLAAEYQLNAEAE